MSLLYWYLRSQQASDYGGRELPLDVHAKAHKEHIVPFSWLHPAFDNLGASGHAKRHTVNAIGNLTFLSEEFNFDHGADPVALWATPKNRLHAHVLEDDGVREVPQRK